MKIARIIRGEEPKSKPRTTGDWLDKILTNEKRADETFLGSRYDRWPYDHALNFFASILKATGGEQVKFWRQQMELEVHCPPPMVLTRTTKLTSWKIRPEQWYWDVLAADQLKRMGADDKLMTVSECRLGGEVILVDRRLKPAYDNGQQMFGANQSMKEYEFIGRIIERLRLAGTINGYKPQSSRFNVSADEWQKHIRPALGALLGLEIGQIHLESTIEMNVIPQLYPQMPRGKDGQTDVSVWLEEYFKDDSYRLDGGYSVDGGLSSVDDYDAGSHWYDRAFRPLGVVTTLPIGS